jgi:hypothetical protein
MMGFQSVMRDRRAKPLKKVGSEMERLKTHVPAKGGIQNSDGGCSTNRLASSTW